MKTNCFDCRYSRPSEIFEKQITCENAASVFRRCNVTKEVKLADVSSRNCPDFEYEDYGTDPIFVPCCDASRTLVDCMSLEIRPPAEKGRKPMFLLGTQAGPMKIDYCPGCGSALRMRTPKPKGKKK